MIKNIIVIDFLEVNWKSIIVSSKFNMKLRFFERNQISFGVLKRVHSKNFYVRFKSGLLYPRLFFKKFFNINAIVCVNNLHFKRKHFCLNFYNVFFNKNNFFFFKRYYLLYFSKFNFTFYLFCYKNYKFLPINNLNINLLLNGSLVFNIIKNFNLHCKLFFVESFIWFSTSNIKKFNFYVIL